MKKSICISLKKSNIERLNEVSEVIGLNKSFILDKLLENLNITQIRRILKRKV